MIGGITRENKTIGIFKDVYIRKFSFRMSLSINNGYVRDFYLKRTKSNYVQQKYYKSDITDFARAKEVALQDTKSIVAQISLFLA